jgi:hypothetical protein
MNALVPVNTAPAFSMNDIAKVAHAIATGGLFGSRDPNAVLTLCLLAHAEGQHPAVVFRDYHIIQGKPAKKADAMLRDFINAGGKVEWHQLDDTKADATFTHPSGSARIDWTLDRARQAKIANPMWQKYPRQMLRSRVISEGVRTVYPGATSGLYEENEVHDIVAETPNPAMEAQDGGFLEGHIQEASRSGEPQEPVTPNKRVKLDGPYTSKTALWTAFKALDRDLRGCGDADEFDCLLDTADAKALIEQCERDAPQLLHGGEDMPPEFLPLHKLIEQRRYDFEQLASAQHMADLART